VGHWLKRIDEIFIIKKSQLKILLVSFTFPRPPSRGEGTIMDKVNKTGEVVSWCVYLPEFLNPSPRSKYFSFERYGGRDIALKEAIAYRDSAINKWFTDNGYIVDL